MDSSIESIAKEIKEKKSYLIGVCGIPGSGKSHYSQILNQLLEKSIIIPMDGFHLFRKDLTSQGIRFRGAAFTFDLKAFKAKIEQLSSRKSFPIFFPSFDHAVKDPIQNSITVNESYSHIIVEGLYLFDESLELDCWDYKIWIESDIDLAMDRVAKQIMAYKDGILHVGSSQQCRRVQIEQMIMIERTVCMSNHIQTTRIVIESSTTFQFDDQLIHQFLINQLIPHYDSIANNKGEVLISLNPS